jgi:hypothetical protein
VIISSRNLRGTFPERNFGGQVTGVVAVGEDFSIQLAKIIVTPAVNLAILFESTCVVRAKCQLDNVCQGDRRRRNCSACCRILHAALAIIILPPTSDCSVGRQKAIMVRASVEVSDGRSEGVQLCKRDGLGRMRALVSPIGGCTRAKNAKRPGAPTLHLAVVAQNARMMFSRHNLEGSRISP